VKKVFKYLLPYWWMLIILFGATCISVWATLQLPTLMAHIIDNGILVSNQDYIINKGLEMLLVTAIGSAAAIISGFFASRVAAGFSRSLYAAVFTQVMSFSQAEINKFSTASLLTRSTNDIQGLQRMTVMILRMCLQAPIMAVGAVLNALATAPNMAWIMVLSVLSFLALVVTLFMAVLPKFKKIQKLVDRLNLVARENLTGLRIIRAFRNEKYEEAKFDKANDDLTSLNLWVNRAISLMQPIMTLIVNGTLLAIIWVGAHYISNDQLEIGNMLAFMQYALQVIMSFMFLAVLMIFLPRAMVSAGRIGEVLNTEHSIEPPTNPKKLDSSKRGIVEFHDVTFTYNGSDTPVLNDVNFTAVPGQTTAFIGSTGSGKSTLINLIPRFYDVTAGEVLIDGVNVKDIAPEDLVRVIGYIPQKGVLFSGTVESNIKYGSEQASEEEVKRAATVAQADFIEKLDGAFGAHIAQNGSNVSGGQKQRLSIARAIVKDPEIYIFDDSFSALDYKTDAALRKALVPVAKNATVLIVAQRISTVKQAEQIIVLDEGHVVGSGTHAELLRNCPVYQEIARSQFSDEEMKKELEEAKTSAKSARGTK
jgi:ATP-binding cassette subfamily B protein